MPVTNPLFWQGLTFSTGAIVLVVLSIWWLYWSPAKGRVGPASRPSPRLAAWLSVLLGLAAIQLVAGGFWDGSMHIKTGRVPAGADFLWPPHIMIYSAFLLSFLVAIVAVAVVGISGWRSGERDPRLWVRRAPYLGLVAVASLYSLLSIPGDALWHALYGIDLTAWSPPHVMIAAMMCAVMIAAVGLLVQARPEKGRWGRFDLAIPVLLGLMLNVAMLIGTIEWEIWGGDFPLLVRQYPVWVYPLVAGGLAFATLVLARRLSRFPWAATLATAAFFTVRLATSAAMSLSHNVVPSVPVLFVLGAVLLDVIPWDRLRSPVARDAGMAAAFTLGTMVLALPILATRAHLPRFTAVDMILAVVTTLALTFMLLPLVRLAAVRLLGSGARRAEGTAAAVRHIPSGREA